MNSVRQSMLAVYSDRAMCYVYKRYVGCEFAVDDEVSLRDLRDAWKRMGGDAAELDAIDAAHLAAVKANVGRPLK